MTDKPMQEVTFAQIEAIPEMLAAAKAVCWFDWSDNDPDAVAAIDALRAAIAKATSTPGNT